MEAIGIDINCTLGKGLRCNNETEYYTTGSSIVCN